VEALQTKSAVVRTGAATRSQGSEETRTGISLLQPIGVSLVAVAVVWWITYYTKVGGFSGAFPCLVLPCQTAADTGTLAYSPFLLWIGLAVWLAGIVLSPRRLNPTPLLWLPVGIPLLWGIWITVDKALVLFK